MYISAAQEIQNNKVKLVYKNSPYKPYNAPSYKIDKQYADEFVKKYNSKTSELNKLTACFSMFGAVVGFAAAGKKLTSKIFKGLPIGAFSGLIAGGIISYSCKNNLMEKYNVRKY